MGHYCEIQSKISTGNKKDCRWCQGLYIIIDLLTDWKPRISKDPGKGKIWQVRIGKKWS